MTTVGGLSLSERLELNKLYRKGPAVFGFLKSLVIFKGLPRVKVNHFLSGKPLYTKFKNRRRTFPTLQDESRFINDIRCMDLTQVNKLCSWNSKTKLLVVSVDVYPRFVRVQLLRIKNAATTRAAFIRMCSDRGTNLPFRKNCGLIEGRRFWRFSTFLPRCWSSHIPYSQLDERLFRWTSL